MEAQPVGGAVGALVVPLLSAGEVGRHGGELELHLVDGGAQAAQVEAEVGVLREHLEHARIVSKKRSYVQP